MASCCTKDLKLRLKLCVDFLQNYLFLSDLYIIEFFTENHWKKLPPSWQCALANLNLRDIPHRLLTSLPISQKHSILPLSLLCFIKCVSVLPLSRTYNGMDEIFDKTSFSSNKLLQKHTGPKKRHEIQALSKLICDVYKKHDCTLVADVGSGQGHLSRMLNLKMNLPVMGIEHSEEFVKLARIFDNSASESMKSSNLCLPKHITFTISPCIDHENFIQLLSSNGGCTERCLLTGLHACGDLSATMIRIFAESSSIQSLVAVSCCYIKLTTDSGDPGKYFKSKTCFRNRICYPMSSFTKNLAGHQLSYRALKLACHGIENTREALKSNDPKFRVQTYRAVLEYVIVNRCKDLKRQAVKTIKHAHRISFDQYASAALKKLNMKFEEYDFKNSKIYSMIEQSNKVTVLFTLALMLGPVIETVILLDRMLYLNEHGITSNISVVFDPNLSPRCFAIVASK